MLKCVIVFLATLLVSPLSYADSFGGGSPGGSVTAPKCLREFKAICGLVKLSAPKAETMKLEISFDGNIRQQCENVELKIDGKKVSTKNTLVYDQGALIGFLMKYDEMNQIEISNNLKAQIGHKSTVNNISAMIGENLYTGTCHEITD